MAKGTEAPELHKFEAKIYGIDADAKSGRKKVGDTAVVQAPNLLEAIDKVRALMDGIKEENRPALHSINVKLIETPEAADANPFAF